MPISGDLLFLHGETKSCFSLIDKVDILISNKERYRYKKNDFYHFEKIFLTMI